MRAGPDEQARLARFRKKGTVIQKNARNHTGLTFFSSPISVCDDRSTMLWLPMNLYESLVFALCSVIDSLLVLDDGKHHHDDG